MKVEYLIKLFNNFNKQFWTNKIFSYFLIIIIIGYTISLRNYPEIYYKYLYNPLVLLILICYILLIAKYNIPLGFMLTFSLIALYYPKNKNITEDITETFGNEEDDNINVPVYGEDKNIVDDTPKKTKKSKTTKNNKEDFEDGDEDEKEDFENDKEDDEDDDEEEDDKKKTKKKTKERFTEDDDEVKEIGLEKLNPTYYKKNKNDTKNDSKNNTNTKNKTITEKKNKKTEKEQEPKKEGETFIGDVRQVIKDLDTGRGGMNASNAIKEINNLFYDKHKLNIKKMIEEDDDSEESDDDDFF